LICVLYASVYAGNRTHSLLGETGVFAWFVAHVPFWLGQALCTGHVTTQLRMTFEWRKQTLAERLGPEYKSGSEVEYIIIAHFHVNNQLYSCSTLEPLSLYPENDSYLLTPNPNRT